MPNTPDARRKALNEALAQINKEMGPHTVMRLGEAPDRDVATVSTGSLGVDLALGIGGLPRARISEIFGPESSGKTTLALSCIAQAQRHGGRCAFIDAEHALDPAWAMTLGVDTDELLLSQPDCGEQALEIVDTLVQCQALDVIVVDSVAALTPKAEIEGEMGEPHMGLQARLMSQAPAQAHRPRTPLRLVRPVHQPGTHEDRGVPHPLRRRGDHDRRACAQVLRFGAPRHPALTGDPRGRAHRGEPDAGARDQKQARAAVPSRALRPALRGGDLAPGGDPRLRDQLRGCSSVRAPGTAAASSAWGRGREKANTFLKAHPEIEAQIEADVRHAMGLPSNGG